MKKNKMLFALVFAAGVALMPGPAVAHHGDAGRYDETLFTITGTIVELRLVNPHSIVVFEAPDPRSEGKVVRWQAEMGGGGQLTRQFGWNKESPKIGDRVTLVGRKVKSGAPYMNMTERAQMVLTDTGKEIFRTMNFGQPEEPARSGAPAPAPAKQ